MSWSIIIQARVGSTRLPNKIILPFAKGKSILQVIIENLLTAFPSDKIIVATTDSELDNRIEQIANYYSVNVFRGDENHVLKRFIDCSEYYGINKIIRLCADNPFIIPEYIKLLLEQATEDDDYLSFAFPDNTPTIQSHIGLFTEYTKLTTLRMISEFTHEKHYLEHVTNYLYTNPDKFKIRFLPVPRSIQSRKDIRLTIDTINDFELLKKLYLKLPNVTSPDFINSLLLLIDSDPEIKQKMQNQIKQNAKK
ncbi:MAG TPA: aminotransferase [Bacteroidales bacterium]|nr:aminotransferase [Bacteroidales bacterium]